MHVKPSGIAILCGMIGFLIAGSIVGWRLVRDPSVLNPNDVVLPEHLAQSNEDRFPVYTDRLASTWSRKTKVVANYGPEVLPLEEGAIAEVRCNGDNGPMYSVDSLGRVFKDGKQVYDTSRWPVCIYLEVHAGTPESVGKAYVVSMVR